MIKDCLEREYEFLNWDDDALALLAQLGIATIALSVAQLVHILLSVAAKLVHFLAAHERLAWPVPQ